MQRDAEPLRPALPAESLLNAPGEHPAVAARRFEVQRAEAELRLTRRFIQFPEITVGRVDIEEPGFKSAGLLVGGSWPLPLFDRQQPEQAGAASRLTAARVRLEIEKTRRQARWDGGLAGYSELRRAALAASDSLASVDSVIQAATARFNAGESTATDLLETLGSVLGARLAALDLFEEALAAHRRLELAALRWSSEQEVKP
jgi:outer membrane protein TolC